MSDILQADGEGRERGGGLGGKVYESKLLSISWVSDCNTSIDQSFDMRGIILPGYQNDIRVRGFAHCVVHNVLENML